jgi:hypothetical protein
MRAVATGFVAGLIGSAVAMTVFGGGGVAAAGASTSGSLSPACGLGFNAVAAPRETDATLQPASAHWQSIGTWNLPNKSPVIRLVPWSEHGAALFAVVDDRIEVSRTTDGGGDWGSLHEIASDLRVGDGAMDLSAVGRTIDLVHLTKIHNVKYRFTTDAALTWTDDVTLGRSAAAESIQVARGSDGTVAVAWATADSNGYAWVVRVSRDGGHSFGAARVAGHKSFGGGCVDPGPGEVALAVAGHAVVIEFHKTDDRLVTRRSVDGGLTWADPVTISSNSFDRSFGLAGSGEQLLTVFANETGLRARTSYNGGRSWTQASYIAGPRLENLAVGRSDGRWSIAVSRHGVLLYSHSSDGSTWSSYETIASSHAGYYQPASPTTLNGKPVVAYYVDPDVVIAERQ